jgi:UDP-N-acetylmuramoyl-tripeptide--D-alanyl-D-alanine ligase
LITAIAPAHIENLGSIENIVKAKLEIADGLSESGTLVLNSDSDILIQGAKANKSSKPTRYFGTREFADVKLIKVDGRGIDGISVEIEFNEERPAPFSIPIMGKHNGMNVAAAILASKLLVPDISWETIRVGLSRFVAPDMRLRRYPTCSGMEIVDDSYNANPESMRAMLTIADETAKQGRKVGLVLGDMLELGDISEDAHREVGKIAVDMTPEFIAAVGPQSKVIAVESSRSGINTYWFNEVEEAVSNCGLFECDVLFVKASRGTGLDRLVKALAF